MDVFSHTEGFNDLNLDQWKGIDTQYESLVRSLPFAKDEAFLKLQAYQQRFILGYTFKDMRGFKWADLCRFAYDKSDISTNLACAKVAKVRDNPFVKPFLRQIDETRVEFLGFSIQRIIEEELSIAFSDVTDYLDKDGLLPIDKLKTLPPTIRRAIKSIEQTSTKWGPKYKITLWDKGKALSRLEQIKGMYRQVLDLQTPGNTPININVSMSPQEASDAYAKMLKGNNE